MEFRQLQIFLAIWQTHSLSKAATKVNLTQPTVSAHLKALEDELGVRLFDRSPKGVFPTKAGKLIYPQVKKILELSNLIVQSAREFNILKKGLLEIGASNIPGQYVLPSLLGKFKRQYPAIEIRLFISDTAKIVQKVFDEQIELGLVGAKLDKPPLIFEKVFTDELILIASKDHHFSKRSSIHLKELTKEPLIMREQGSGTRLTIEKALKAKGIRLDELQIVLEAGSTEAVRQAVKAGVGCAILSKKAAKDDLCCGSIISPRIEDFQIKRNIYLVYKESRWLTPPSKVFIKFLLDIAATKK